MAEKSKVYFADFRAPSWRENLPQKLARLMMTAGFGDIDMDGKYVAIKMHFGEPGNLAYLRPNWARAVVDLVKSHGGKPFLTDCNTLYVGGRKNALDHIESAYINGFTPYSTGWYTGFSAGSAGRLPVSGSFAGSAGREPRSGSSSWSCWESSAVSGPSMVTGTPSSPSVSEVSSSWGGAASSIFWSWAASSCASVPPQAASASISARASNPASPLFFMFFS